jgi:hypothetical protein
VADSLDAYNVKERLLNRWREVAQEDMQQAQEAQEPETEDTDDVDNEDTGTADADADDTTKQRKGSKSSGGASQGTANGTATPGAHSHTGGDFVSPMQNAFFSALHSYADITLPCRPYPTRLDETGKPTSG